MNRKPLSEMHRPAASGLIGKLSQGLMVGLALVATATAYGSTGRLVKHASKAHAHAAQVTRPAPLSLLSLLDTQPWFRARKATPPLLDNASGQILGRAGGTNAPNVADLLKGGLADLRSTFATGIRPAYQGVTWFERGPNNFPGRMLGVASSQTTSNKMWAASAGGGIWASTTGGTSWQSVSDFLPNMAISCVATVNGNPNVLLAGTGESYAGVDLLPGSGILRSVDGGASWAAVSGTAQYGTVSHIFSSTKYPAVFYAICGDTTVGGSIIESADSGQTWYRIVKTNIPNSFIQGGAISPDGNHLVFSFMDGSTLQFHVVYITNAHSSGTLSGNLAAAPLQSYGSIASRTEFGFCAGAKNLLNVYANVADSLLKPGTPDAAIYASTDGGATWTQKATGTGSTYQFAPIWVDQTNPAILVVGGTNLYRSTDSGATITQISDSTLANNPHAGVKAIVAEPRFNGTTVTGAYIATEAGVYYTSNIYTAATSSYVGRNLGLNTTQYYGADGLSSSGLLFGGTQDNGSLKLTIGSLIASQVSTADSGFPAIDAASGDLFLSDRYLKVRRSLDSGATTTFIDAGLGDAGLGYDGTYYHSAYIAPLVEDPSNPGVFYGGGQQLWRSVNGLLATPTWYSVRPVDSNVITAVAVSASTPNTVWVGQKDGVVAYTNDVNDPIPVWKYVTGLTNGNPVLSLMIDPSNPSIVYVGYGGETTSNLWKTIDGGTTWTDATGATGYKLPASNVNVILRHTTRPHWIFVGTDAGMYWSIDDGYSWSDNTAGPTSAAIRDLRFLHGSNTILAATHGRGLWTADLTPPGSNLSIGAIPDKTVKKLSNLTFRLPVVDSFGAFLAYTMTSSPPATGATLGQNGVFSWTPGQGYQNITYTITATVSDDYGSSQQATFHVFVQDVNTPPMIPAPAPNPLLATPGGTVSYPLVATDNDLPAQTLTPLVYSGPSWVHWDGSTITFNPPSTVPGGNYPVTLSVTDNGTPNLTTYRSFLVHVAAATLKSAAYTTYTVEGGNNATLTVTLVSPAPSGGTTVALKNRDFLQNPPASITVPQGQITASATFSTNPVKTAINSTMYVTLGSTTALASIRVLPPTVASISLNPTTVTGGTNSTATVTLTRAAPANGVLVSLQSSSQAVGNVPTSLFIPAGQTQGTFTITTKAFFGTPTVTISASANGTTVSAVLTVNIGT